MDFSTIKSITIPEGTVKQLAINGVVAWRKSLGYVPCDGITNAASTSIDTGIKAQDNIEMFVRFKAVTGSFYILQSRQTGSATIYGISGSQTNNTITSFGLTSGISRTAGHDYSVKLTMVNRAVTLYVKDETTGAEDTKTGTASSSTYTFPSPTTIKLYGDASMVSSGVTVYRAYIKINGTMAWDMYPCVDVNNSNAPVAYDDVTRAASAKLSGSITAGSIIQPIAYAQSDGTAWADTEIVPDNTSGFELLCRLTSEVNDDHIFGCVSTGGQRWTAVRTGGGSGETYVGFSTQNRPRLATAYNSKISVRNNFYNDRKIYISDGVQQAEQGDITATLTDTMTNALVFAYQKGTNITKHSYQTFALKITQGTTLVRDYLPVRLGTTVELFDLVNWKFATRTGTLTAGADIEYEWFNH